MSTAPILPGQTLHGFTVTAVIPLPELNLSMIRLHHQRTGARMVHLASSDDNNLFAVGFRTPPADSSGVAHILEHTVLCGSRRFPVRDPFFSMLKRSLNTFMNAMTASDWTLYPFASRNPKDFNNLREIYLDAAFFPLLRERDFRQEGHRLEFAEAADPTTPLTYKGVVYNEMKGAMASPSSLLSRRLNRALYPTATYRHNSGGEPADIPTLTWQGLKDFHSAFYHPSNAWFFTYGDLPLIEQVQAIDQQVLQHFEARRPDSEVAPEQRLDAPRRVSERYPLDPGEPLEKKTMVQVAWLTCEVTDSFERLALTLLSSLLLGNPAAPLYKALLDSKLGSNLAPGTGYADDNRTTYFAAGLQGTEPDHADAIEELILATLEQVATAGFAPERIEAAIHRLEFSNREVSGNSYPYPLALLMRMIGPWLHGDDPVSPLQLDDNLQRLGAELAAGPFFQNLIRRHLLDNRHRVTLTLRPDPTLGAAEEARLQQRLAEVNQQLDAAARAQLVQQARELQQAQEEPEDLSCLPTLGRADIPATEQAVPVTLARVNGQNVQWCEQPTNGIGYFIAHLPTDQLPPDLIPLLPIFGALLTQVGAAGLGYEAMAERMEAGTGGIQAGVEILEDLEQFGAFQGRFEIRGKALNRKQGELFDILGDLCARPDFSDRARLATVLNQVRANLENAIPGSGHSFAARAAAGRLSPAGARKELWTGLTLLRLVRSLAEQSPEQLGHLAERLQTLARLLFDGRRLACAVTGEGTQFEQIRTPLVPFLSGLPSAAPTTSAPPPAFAGGPAQLGWATSVPVAYVTRVFPAVPYTHGDAAPLTVLAKLLRAGYLHREIREKGGAYGGLAGYDAEAGLFSLLSYRDPHIVRTLQVYDDAAQWASRGEFGADELTEALLAVFADLDRPLSPGGKGNREFANLQQGLTPALRRQFRRRILAVDAAALARVARTYLMDGRPASAVSVIAGEELLLKANAAGLTEPFVIARI